MRFKVRLRSNEPLLKIFLVHKAVLHVYIIIYNDI